MAEVIKIATFPPKLFEHRYKALFFLTLLGYILLYSSYGFTERDDGFVTSLAWRIYNGQLPYIDFIYVRPPATLFLHSIPFFILPREVVIFSERVLFYLSLSVASYFGSKSAIHVLGEGIKNTDEFLLSTLVFVYSVNSFNPMAWHSIDGVLFGSIGVFLIITNKSWYKTGAGLLFLFLAAMTKQSFYPLPFLGVLYIWVSTRSFKKGLVAFSLLLILTGTLFVSLKLLGIWSEFLSQTTSVTTLKDAYTSGVYIYLHTPVVYFLVPAIIFLLSHNLSKWIWGSRVNSHLPLVLVIFSYAYSVAFYLNRLFLKDIPYHEYINLKFGDPVPIVLFIVAVIYLIAKVRDSSKFTGLGFMLCLSWCAGISWAQSSPYLYSAPWITIPVIASTEYFGAKKPNNIILGLIGAGLIVYYLGYLKPFNSEMRSEIKYDLELIAPDLRYIKGDKRIYSQLQELSKHFRKYRGSSAVLPAMPLVDFLFNRPFLLPLDWAMNCETAGKDRQILNAVERNCDYVFVSIEWRDEAKRLDDDNRKFNSRVTIDVSKTWKLVDSSASYLVYKNPFK